MSLSRFSATVVALASLAFAHDSSAYDFGKLLKDAVTNAVKDRNKRNTPEQPPAAQDAKDSAPAGQTAGGRPLLSELRNEDFIQNSSNPVQDPNDSRISIAGNLLIDVAGVYPKGYQPAWRFITKASNLSVKLENWEYPKSQAQQSDIHMQIGDYAGKAVIRFTASGTGAECFADIMIKNAPAVLTGDPQVFEIGNFRRILNDRSTGEACVFSSSKGGWGGRIGLSANRNGDISMDLMLESYTVLRYSGSRVFPSQVALRRIANGITIENEMSAQKAIAVIAAEREAKERLREYTLKTQQQADELQKSIAARYPQGGEVRQCFESSKGAYIKSTDTDYYYTNSGNYAGSRTSYDMNITTVIKNKCAYPIAFVGIQQLHNEAQGYYLIEVKKSMPANYVYSADQGALGALFSSMIGAGSEFDLRIQERYVPKYASVGSTQWLKVVKN